MAKLKFTVLGCSAAYPSMYGACSGYLVETQKTKILLDCGSGIYQKLIQRIELKDLDAVVLSHLHSDHMSDALVMRYALMLNEMQPVKLFMPEKPEAESYILRNSKHFDIETIKENEKYNVGDIQLEFKKTKHSILSFATKIKTDKNVIVYSGDTEYTSALSDFAKWSDLFVCDATFNEETFYKGAPHASAKQAGIMAREAEAAKLLLTHFSPNMETEKHLAEAKNEFKYTSLAKPDLTINV